MRILGTQYTLSRKALEIYLSGCKGDDKLGHCPNCHNPESWSFNKGELYTEKYFEEKIKRKIKDFPNIIDNIEIYGGEPNDQNHIELESFLMDLNTLHKKIWLFTRYDLNNCPKFEYGLCDYIKCGRYIEELNCENNLQHGIRLATSNQHIYKRGVDY